MIFFATSCFYCEGIPAGFGAPGINPRHYLNIFSQLKNKAENPGKILKISGFGTRIVLVPRHKSEPDDISSVIPSPYLEI